MIKLTRLRQNTPFILNPDHIERVDTHVDTVVRLTTGAEYVVNETGDDIVRMTIDYRARVLASAGRMAVTTPEQATAQAAEAVAASAPEAEPVVQTPVDDVPVDDAPAEAQADAGTETDTETAPEEVAS